VLVLSPRPGRIADLIDVDLGPERDIDIMTSDRFGAYARRVRNHFNSRGGIE
jgi:NitT/TauT family transport system ATP-binding protein